MDQTTQQNAAMVEESNAASSELAVEAGKLRELISKFRIDGSASMQSASLHATAKAMANAAPEARTSAPARASGSGEDFGTAAAKPRQCCPRTGRLGRVLSLPGCD
jgi:septal ring factor EnvC (AmiA/AmiB activator)